jgi:hypothetical protein
MSDETGRITVFVVGHGEGLQALSSDSRPPLGAFIKPPTLQVVHDFTTLQREERSLCTQSLTSMQ